MAHYYEGAPNVKKAEIGDTATQPQQPLKQHEQKEVQAQTDGDIKNLQNTEVNIGTG